MLDCKEERPDHHLKIVYLAEIYGSLDNMVRRLLQNPENTKPVYKKRNDRPGGRIWPGFLQ
jgi:hypothetical protein